MEPTPRKQFDTDTGKPFNHLRVEVDEAVTNISGRQIVWALDEGEPRIAVGMSRERSLYINAAMLQPGEEFVVAGRLIQVIRRAQNGR